MNIYINKDEKIASLLAGDVNVLQSMLVYCMFLDEHVNHEPQTILYFKRKLTLQSGEIMLKVC